MRRVMLMPLMCVALLACLSPVLSAQDSPAVFAGNWTGMVKATLGEMPIQAAFKVDGDKVTGEITTFHGGFKIEKSAREKDGRWKLSFVTPDGLTGSITGAVKGDEFSGDWDFRPNATGTFALKREK